MENIIDWEKFLEQHDLTFNQLPQSWREAPHFGNANIGSMLYGQNGNLCLEIFRADVCDHREEDFGWTAYSRPRFRLGHFQLQTKGKIISCQWRKSLWNATLNGIITTECGEFEITHFVHSIDSAIITNLKVIKGDENVHWEWNPHEAKTTRAGYPSNEEERQRFAQRFGKHYLDTLQKNQDNPQGVFESIENINLWTQDLLAGGQYTTGWMSLNENNENKFIVSIENTPQGTGARQEILNNLERFSHLEAKQWYSEHCRWWHDFYPQSYLSIPDKPLEALYWQTIYRYGCLSRTGRYYVDTSGLWFQGAQWPYSTHDWNTQAAHWGVYAANRLDQGGEIVERLHQNSDNMIAAVYPEEWREDSAYLHLATAGDFKGTRISDKRYFNLIGCLPWLIHNAWWQYRFSMDKEMLKEKIFPILKRSMNMYIHLSYKDDNGKIHLEPTYSPETDTYEDCNFDLALFKWGCHTLLHSCKVLELNDPLIPKWTEIVENLIEFPEDQNGFMLGSQQTAYSDHRHLSHLMMIYPLYLVNIEQEGKKEILNKSYSLAHNGSGSDGHEELGNLHGMVQTHAGPIGSALGDGDRALEGLKRLQAELHSNGLWSCSNNPCIESTVSIVNNIQDMLIQSWSDPALNESGAIRIFPALPNQWDDIEFHNLRTEGAFLVSAKRSQGKTQWVKIKSLAGEPCKIKIDFKPETQSKLTLNIVEKNIYTIQLQKNEEIILQNNH